MSVFKPFRALRPLPAYAHRVAALPYDVMTTEEAAERAKGNPLSFIHVEKAETDLPCDTPEHSELIYETAAKNLKALEEKQICRQDKIPCFYIFEQSTEEHSQTGLVGCASIDAYLDGSIKKHELTRKTKEEDRIRHVDACDANTGPIFLAYKEGKRLREVLEAFKNSCLPVYDFVSEGEVENKVWVINSAELVSEIEKIFDEEIPALYIADGHHRCASAVNVGLKRREENKSFDGSEEFNFFLAVAFPGDELDILPYNRVIRDLNGLSAADFLKKLEDCFELSESKDGLPVVPKERHLIGMLLDGKWYSLRAKEKILGYDDPVASLDVSVLHENIIAPLLGIKNPRTDERISFVGGKDCIAQLEKKVSEGARLAFSLYPTSIEELFRVADENLLMPPKSTWFEPKLLSGLFVHKLS